MSYRLGIVTSHVIQYQDPLFKRLALRPELETTVLFCSPEGARSYRDPDMGVDIKWDVDLLSGYRHEYLRNVSPWRHGLARLINPGLLTAISRRRFDAVGIMLGWGSVSAVLAYVACLVRGVPYFVYGDQSFVEPTEERGLKGALRGALLRALFSRAAGFWVCGTMNGDVYRHYGADPRRFFHVPWAVDNERLASRSDVPAAERQALRARWGIAEDRVVLLFAGKLIRRKNPDHMIDAVTRMRLGHRATVLYMGDGEERGALERLARERGVDARFTGFVNQSEIPKVYAAADVFVLPSSFDPRGTVTNEAMACGLPVVITDRVGVYGEGDIVRPGENGFVYTVGDNARLAAILDELVGDAAQRRRMGARSREIIATWGLDADVEGIIASMRAVTGARPTAGHVQPPIRPRAGVTDHVRN